VHQIPAFGPSSRNVPQAERGLRVHEHLGHVLTAVSLPREERDRVRQLLFRQGVKPAVRRLDGDGIESLRNRFVFVLLRG
jgi:hypothetical protein